MTDHLTDHMTGGPTPPTPDWRSPFAPPRNTIPLTLRKVSLSVYNLSVLQPPSNHHALLEKTPPTCPITRRLTALSTIIR